MYFACGVGFGFGFEWSGGLGSGIRVLFPVDKSGMRSDWYQCKMVVALGGWTTSMSRRMIMYLLFPLVRGRVWVPKVGDLVVSLGGLVSGLL